MTLTELRYVVAAARHRHFGRAAESCFVSQPTLSVGIRKLEEELGVRLFERTRSDVIITPIGEQIVAQAEAVLQAAEDIRQTAAAAADPLGGELRLGVIYTIGPYLVPQLIPALRELAPELTLLVQENFTDRLVEQLRRGDIDCAVMSPPIRDTQLIQRALYEEPFKVVVPADHPLAKRKRIKPSQLDDERLLLLGAGNCFRDQVVGVCPACLGPASGELQRTLEGSSLNTIVQMVATGVGVTIVPGTMPIGDELDELVAVRPFASPQPTRGVSLFYRRGFARPALVNALAEAVRNARLAGVRYAA
ncbi:MAG: LysR substrate-binding domain-containing protein [Gammaproteobacteria bacterium]